ncbi:hypothetical protein D3C87_406380 [compost metagenome]
MLNQEIIYQYLHAKNYSPIITLLYENGNSLDNDPNVERAIHIFMEQFFNYVKESTKITLLELNHDLDILFITHIKKKYTLRDDHLLTLFHLVSERISPQYIEEVARKFPNDQKCIEFVEKIDRAKALHEKKLSQTSTMNFIPSTQPTSGKKFETEVRSNDQISWVKVYLRSSDLLEIVSIHGRY